MERIHIIGIIVTIVLHGGVGTAVAVWDGHDDEVENPRAKFDFTDAQVIEASLAFKAPEQKKKSRQPQKKKNPMVAPPEVQGVSRDAEKAPVEPKKTEEKPPPEFVDPTSTFKKARNIDLDMDPTEGGEEDLPGSVDGSEWGTADQAKGDEYVGELHGRIKEFYSVPTLETQAGQALGCVRLTPDGKIAERKLYQPSGIANLDRAVNEALRKASDMERAVPSHLINLLTKQGICFRFNLE